MKIKEFIEFVMEEIKNTVYCFVYHTPTELLNREERDKIKEYGLIHFCNCDNLESIMKLGVTGGNKKPMRKIETNYTWFYINLPEAFEKNKNIIHSKGERILYDGCVIIREITEEHLDNMRIRRKLDNAVIFPGTLLTDDIKGFTIDEYQKRVGF